MKVAGTRQGGERLVRRVGTHICTEVHRVKRGSYKLKIRTVCVINKEKCAVLSAHLG